MTLERSQATDAGADARAPGDRRRWWCLAVCLLGALIIVLDTSVLNVAIPTLIRDLNTDISTVQWVITGYSLTFATFLIVGGRLGDIFGHRRLFVIGGLLFAVGSAIASAAESVGVMIVGEAIIEGLGAALMLPATTAVLSRTFVGRERVTAFAAWGTTVGAGGAFGPLLGGYLTTEHSWRWSFRLNVVVALVTIVGALLFIRDSREKGPRARIDLAGAMLVAASAFLVIFGITSISEQRWDLTVGSLVLAGVTTLAFVLVERRKDRRGEDPILAFDEMRNRQFRNGVVATSMQLIAHGALLFVVPVVLQEVRGLSAFETGVWVVPVGLCIVVGAQAAGRLVPRIGTMTVVRLGLVVATVGLLVLSIGVGGSMAFLSLLPGLVIYGIGSGLATSQIANVVLAAVSPDRAGVASGTNSTGRQVGAALGVAISATVLAGSYTAGNGRTALLIATLMIGIAAVLAWRIPKVGAVPIPPTPTPDEALEGL